jgi:hypothetical protein
MMNPHDINDDAAHVVLHSWISLYLSRRYTAPAAGGNADIARLSTRLGEHASKLQESAAQLAAALEKMRVANAKLALRMAEHKAFFAKYQVPGKDQTAS